MTPRVAVAPSPHWAAPNATSRWAGLHLPAQAAWWANCAHWAGPNGPCTRPDMDLASNWPHCSGRARPKWPLLSVLLVQISPLLQTYESHPPGFQLFDLILPPTGPSSWSDIPVVRARCW